MIHWRCFHCDAVFKSDELTKAQDHFGVSELEDPVCQISDNEVRRMEAELSDYRSEDTALHREIHRLKSNHAQALTLTEEKGYANAIRDIKAGRVEGELRARILDALGSPLNTVLRDVLAHLVAATSLLEKGGKKAAASDRIFSIMLRDYNASIERGRAALQPDQSHATMAGSKGD